MSLTVCRHETVDEFLAAAGGFLEAHESENNLVFGISSAIRVSPELFADDPPRFATVTDADGRTDSLDYVLETKGPERVNYLLSMLDEMAYRKGVELPFAADALRGSGLRLLRPGQRVRITLAGDAGKRHVDRLQIITLA